MKICRYTTSQGRTGIGLLQADSVLDLAPAGFAHLHTLLESDNPLQQAQSAAKDSLVRLPLSEVQLLPPVEHQEIWAAGVTYLRSKKARMEESDFSASAYDRVYEAARPELFFKCLPEKAVPAGEPVGIREDAKWNVPEPELALVLSSQGKIVGFTIGNDMSSRDIEGENTLYLPQAKVYHRSCALGPCITLGASEAEARNWTISIVIERGGSAVFQGETGVSQIKRSFEELAEYLFRSQKFPHGAILLTGTGIVPPDAFTLEAGDKVKIQISGIGELANPVIRV